MIETTENGTGMATVVWNYPAREIRVRRASLHSGPRFMQLETQKEGQFYSICPPDRQEREKR